MGVLMRKPDAVRDHAEYLRYVNEQARLELEAYCCAPLVLEPLWWPFVVEGSVMEITDGSET